MTRDDLIKEIKTAIRAELNTTRRIDEDGFISLEERFDRDVTSLAEATLQVVGDAIKDLEAANAEMIEALAELCGDVDVDLPEAHQRRVLAALEAGRAVAGFSAPGGKGKVLSDDHKAKLREARQKRSGSH